MTLLGVLLYFSSCHKRFTSTSQYEYPKMQYDEKGRYITDTALTYVMINGDRCIQVGEDKYIIIPPELELFKLANFDSIRIDLPVCDLDSRDILKSRCIVDASDFIDMFGSYRDEVSPKKVAAFMSYINRQTGMGNLIRINAYGFEEEFAGNQSFYLSCHPYPIIQALKIKDYLIKERIDLEWNFTKFLISEEPSFFSELLLILEPEVDQE